MCFACEYVCYGLLLVCYVAMHVCVPVLGFAPGVTWGVEDE